MLLRVADATHIYAGLDLSALPGALQPSVVVTAADLARTGIRVPEYYAGDLLCPVGKTPLYLGQPVALLIFEDFDTFDQARLVLRDATFAKFGEETDPSIRRPTTAPFASLASAARLPRRPTSSRRSRTAGLAPAVSRTPGGRYGRDSRFDRTSLCRSRRSWRADPCRTRGGQSSAFGAGPRIRDAVRRPDVSRTGKRNRLV